MLKKRVLASCFILFGLMVSVFSAPHAKAAVLTSGSWSFSFPDREKSGGYPTAPANSDQISVDDVSGRVDAHASYSDRTQSVDFTFIGTVNPTNYELSGEMKGTSMQRFGDGSVTWGSGTISTSFTGTVSGVAYQAQSGDKSAVWEGGTVAITYKSVAEDWSHYRANHADLAPAVGATDKGTLQLFAKGSLPKIGNNHKDAVSVISATAGAEYLPGGKDPSKKLTTSTKLKQGDVVMPGFGGTIVLQIGETGRLVVPGVTSLQIGELTQTANLEKTQLNLYYGSVRANVKHTDAIRSDFTVHAPAYTASIRGSEAVVSYDKDHQTTTVYVTDDQATFYANDHPDTIYAIDVGQKVVGDAKGQISPASKFNQSEIANIPTLSAAEATQATQAVTKNMKWIIVALIVLVIAVIGFVIWRRRTKKDKARP